MKVPSQTLLLFVVFDQATAHGYITLPTGRQDGSQSIHTLSTHYTDKAQSWFTYGTQIPGSPAVCDWRLRTTHNAAKSSDSKISCPYPSAWKRSEPWFAPGTAPVDDPCGTYDNQAGGAKRGTSLPPTTPRSQWRRGTTVKVAWAATANHGGGYAYRLCPANRAPTEACFSEHHLEFAAEDSEVVWPDSAKKVPVSIATRRLAWDASHSNWTLSTSGEGKWTRNPIPLSDGWFPAEGNVAALPRDLWDFSLRDGVRIPSNLALGNYVLSWRWDTEGQHNVWMNCADVELVDSPSPPTPPPPTPVPPPPPPSPAPTPPSPSPSSVYTKISNGGNCCRGTGGELPKGDTPDGDADTPAKCEADCTSNPVCKWFSHSSEWKNCMLCSECEITAEGHSGKYTSWQQGFLPEGGATSDYVEIHRAGACCQGGEPHGEIGKVPDGKAPLPEDCEAACSANSQCMMFSHATEWQNCVLCSRCNFTTTGNAAKYTSWGATVARGLLQVAV